MITYMFIGNHELQKVKRQHHYFKTGKNRNTVHKKNAFEIRLSDDACQIDRHYIYMCVYIYLYIHMCKHITYYMHI